MTSLPQQPSPLILVETYTTRAEWLEARDHPEGATFSLGASDVASNLVTNNPSRFKNSDGAWWLWVAKNPLALERYAEGLEEYEAWKEARRSINFEARRRLEPDIQAMVEQQAGIRVYDPGDFCILRSSERPWTHLSPDGLVVQSHFYADIWESTEPPSLQAAVNNGGIRPHTEYKTIHPFNRHGWDEHEPNLETLVQCQHGLWVTGWDHCIVGAFVGYGDSEQERLVYQVERNEDLIGIIAQAAGKFKECVDRDVPPPVDGFSATTRAIRMIHPAKAKTKGATITLGSQFGQKHFEYLQIKSEIDRLKRRQEQLKQEVEVEMGEASAGVAFVPASESLPAGGKWIRYSTPVKPSACKKCGEVIRRGYEQTRCQVVKQ
jgi:hypothetical protein